MVVSKNISSKTLKVAFGKLFADINESQILQKFEGSEIFEKKVIISHKTITTSQTNKAIIDIRGIRIDQALSTINNFIDKSLLDGLEEIIIIHGVGTGQLRSAIRRELSINPTCREWKSFTEYSNDDSTISFLK